MCLLLNGIGLAVPARARMVASLETVHDLRAPEGSAPNSGLIRGRDGCLYGTTTDNSAADHSAQTYGSVFRLSPDGTLTTLHTFSFRDGAYPWELVQGRDGCFYGTTWKGGTTVFGTVFRLTPDGEFTTLHNFDGSGPDGKYPQAGLLEGSDGCLYGTTEGGGGSGELGTVFRVSPDGTFATIHRFEGQDGSSPSATLIQGKDGFFYGVTPFGGAGFDHTVNSGAGTVFRLTPGGQVTTLHSFHGADGELPVALLQGADGNFYGTTSYGGAGSSPVKYMGSGTLFRITPAGKFTVLHRFGSAGGHPGRGLVQGQDGDLYGTSQDGESYDAFLKTGTNGGTLFRFSLQSLQRTILHDFQGEADGASPTVLLRDEDGSLYGTTSGGGAEDRGTVFRLTLKRLPPLPKLSLSLMDEGASAFLLTLAKPAPADLTVRYTVGGSAVPGIDYVPLSGTCRIKAGHTSKLIKVKPLVKVSKAMDKSVFVLFAASDDYTFKTTAIAVLTLDNP